MDDQSEKANQEVREIEETYSEIDEQIKELEKLIKNYQAEAVKAKESGNPEKLSNTLMRLGRVNSALGNKAAYAKYIARNAERAYRRTRESIKLEEISKKQAIGKAESMGYVDRRTETVYKLYSNVQLLADQADDLCYRTDTFLKMSQSGLSLIKNDIVGRP